MLCEAAALILVALLWGSTNPLIKRNSKDITKIKANSAFKQFILEIKFLLTNVKYLIPLAFNQIGSLLYFLTLQHVDLTLSVPVANSLTFVFTAIMGWILGEKMPKKNTYIGIILIVIGTTLCCYDKLAPSIENVSYFFVNKTLYSKFYVRLFVRINKIHLLLPKNVLSLRLECLTEENYIYILVYDKS